MRRGPALANLTQTIVELCRAGLAPADLRDRVLPRLRRAVPFDAAFWTTMDPATLMFTGPHQQEIPPQTVPYFLENEFGSDDVNRFAGLAREPGGVRTLGQATGGRMEDSARYRDVFRPMGLGDELRAVFRSGDVCWGAMCLHREAGVLFSEEEVDYVRRLAPRLAEGIRAGLLTASVDACDAADAPGLVVLAPDATLVSITEPGRRWLAALGSPDAERFGTPPVLAGLVAALRHRRDDDAALPRTRTRTLAGGWAVLHASPLPGAAEGTVAVIIDEPSPSEIAPVLMMAYGLTEKERALTALVCRGLSTHEISGRLRISANTVQDHLKSIFDKTGVRSRRELVTAILHEQYLPSVMTGRPIAPDGSFAE